MHFLCSKFHTNSFVITENTGNMDFAVCFNSTRMVASIPAFPAGRGCPAIGGGRDGTVRGCPARCPAASALAAGGTRRPVCAGRRRRLHCAGS